MYSFRYVEAATAYYASDLTRGGVNVFVRNAAVCRKRRKCWLVLACLRVHSILHANCLLTSTNIASVFCESAFEGGGWALVRRTTATSIWHQATDNLLGTDVYGSYGTPTSDSIFSIAWNTWQTTGEMLFMTGMRRLI